MKRIGLGLFTVLIVGITVLLLYAYSKTKPHSSTPAYETFRFRNIQGLLDDSARYFSAIDSVYADLPHTQRLYEIYSCKRGYFYTQKRNYQKSLAYSDSILLVLKDDQNNPAYWYWYSIALFKKGDDLNALRRYSEAHTCYFRAREAILRTGDHCLSTDYSTRLGMVAFQAKNYQEAAGYFKLAVSELSFCNAQDIHQAHINFSNTQSNLDNIGLCYSRLGKSDSALYYFDSALNYINTNAHVAIAVGSDNRKIQDTAFIESARAVVYGNKAKDLIAIGKEEEAEELLVESIRLNRKPLHALDDVPYSLSKLAGLYLKQSRVEEAGKLLHELKAGLDTFPNQEVLKRWYRLQSEYLSKKKDYAASNFYLTNYLSMRDSIEAHEPRMPAEDLHTAFETLSKEYELSNLQKEGSIKNLYLLFAGICITAAAIVIWLIYRNFRQSKKHIASLESLNRQVQHKNAHLQHTMKALEKSHEENSRMMKVVAHDLRNPIGGIAGIVGLLLREKNYTQGQRDMLQMIQQSSNNSLKLIQDLVEEHVPVVKANRETVELRDLLGYCVEMLHLKVSEKKQEISLEGAQAFVQGDNEKLWRVFSNLIGNAIKFSPEHARIQVKLNVKQENAVVSITDEGIGIPEEIREKIFTMSTDTKRKGTAGEPSFGLGLAICKQIVEANDGKIWFDSAVGKGTSFFVSFPLHAA
jgi:signal transduction histidine kinase